MVRQTTVLTQTAGTTVACGWRNWTMAAPDAHATLRPKSARARGLAEPEVTSMSRPVTLRPVMVTLAAAAVLTLALAGPLSAAPPAKGTPVGSSFVTSGGATTGGANHIVVADMTVPAGKYHVSARGTVINQTGADIESVACNAYGADAFIDSGTTAARTGYSGFAVEGAVDMPSGGVIRLECIASSVAGPFVTASLVADTVGSITVLP